MVKCRERSATGRFCVPNTLTGLTSKKRFWQQQVIFALKMLKTHAPLNPIHTKFFNTLVAGEGIFCYFKAFKNVSELLYFKRS